jgi:polysaccharide biosynthesis/export protein
MVLPVGAHVLKRLLAVGLFGLAGCSAVGYQISDLAAEINATRSFARHVVAPGDVLRVTFPYAPDFNQTVKVGPDGKAVFLLVDELPVVNLTLAELDAKLTEEYVKRNASNVEQLTVDIFIDTATTGGGVVRADAVLVVGEVRTPGAVALSGRPLTLIEAIAGAGGHLKQSANLRNTILVRRLPSGEMRSWRLDADIYKWGEQPPIYLQARDIIFVPNTAIDDVNIWVDKYIRQMIPLPVIPPPA